MAAITLTIRKFKIYIVIETHHYLTKNLEIIFRL